MLGRILWFLLLFCFVLNVKANLDDSFEDISETDDFDDMLRQNSHEYINSESQQTSSTVQWFCIWGVNIFFVLFVFLRLIFYGEPIHDFDSSSWAEFVRVRKEGDEFFRKNVPRAAQRSFAESLSIIDRKLPVKGLDMYLSLLWQIFRHFLNSLWMGRWLSKYSDDELRWSSSHMCRSIASISLVYHKLHQLSLLYPQGFPSKLSSLHLSISAVNLAEAAGISQDGLLRQDLAAIYLGAALTCRRMLPDFIAPAVALYFIRKARRQILRADPNLTVGLSWTIHPLARKALSNLDHVNQALSAKPSDTWPFVESYEIATPLSKLRDFFKIHLLQALLAQLSSEEPSQYEIAEIHQLLLTICTEEDSYPELIDKEHPDFLLSLRIQDDPVCKWWIHVLMCAISWRQSETKHAQSHYTSIRQCPKNLLKSDLALAIGHSFCTQKLCIEDRTNKNFTPLVAFHAQSALRYLFAAESYPSLPSIINVQRILQSFGYEWLLHSLLDGWRSTLNESNRDLRSPITKQYSTMYKQSLRCFKRLNPLIQADMKTMIYQMTYKIMSGSNPVVVRSAARKIAQKMQKKNEAQIVFKRENAPERYHLYVLQRL